MAVHGDDGAWKPSRIRQLADERVKSQPDRARIAGLEVELDESERRNLHLNRELLNETTLRIRSERERDAMTRELEDVRARLEKEIRVDEGVQRPQRITKGRSNSRVRRTVPQSGNTSTGVNGPLSGEGSSPQEPTITDVKGDRVPPSPPVVSQSSRKRGGVK